MSGWVAGFYHAGADAVQGLIDGIKSLASGPIDAVKAMGQGVAEAFRSVLGIHSPSLVMQEAGINVAMGVKQGIDEGAASVAGSSASLGDGVVGSFAPVIGSSSTSNSNAVNNDVRIDLVVNVHGGEAGSVGHDVYAAVEQAMRQAFARTAAQG